MSRILTGMLLLAAWVGCADPEPSSKEESSTAGLQEPAPPAAEDEPIVLSAGEPKGEQGVAAIPGLVVVDKDKPIMIGPGMPGSEIRELVSAHRQSLKSCAKAHESQKGRIEISVLLGEGKVQAAQALKNTTGSDALSACLLEEARSWPVNPDLSGDKVLVFEINR